MTSINLLPPEILERRRTEKRMVYIALGGMALGLVLAVVWASMYLGVQDKKAELATAEQEVKVAQVEAERLAVFEQTATELQTRAETVDRALAGRLDWARLFDELSLVLPSDLWAESITATEDSGLAIQGWAIDAPTDTPDAGHKSIAKMLVRLADLEQLEDVWLTNSAKALFRNQDAIQYTVTARVIDTSVEDGTSDGAGTTSGQ